MTAGDPPEPAAGLTFQERFAALEREWKEQLPARMQEARSRMAACRAAPDDQAGLEELHRLLHTLAGSAGTFGLGDLGAASKAIEHELDRLMVLPARGGADFETADRALQALAATVPGA